MKNTLRIKLTRLYTVTFLVIVFFFVSVISFVFYKSMIKRYDDDLNVMNMAFKEAFSKVSDKSITPPLLPKLMHYKKDLPLLQREFNRLLNKISGDRPVYSQILYLTSELDTQPGILVKSSTLIKGNITISDIPYVNAMLNINTFRTQYRLFGDSRRVITSRLDYRGKIYILQIGISINDVVNILEYLILILIIAFPLLLALVSYMGFYFIGKTLTPVNNMVKLTQSITAEDLGKRIEIESSDDEIGELAVTLNGMIERLDYSFKNMKQFTDDVSHELKSPLTSLRLQLEVALRKKRSVEEYENIMRDVLEEEERISGIIENLLYLSRADSWKIYSGFKPINLDDVLLENYEKYLHLADVKKIHFELGTIDVTEVKGIPEMITRMISNLIDNAIKYTDSGECIKIQLMKKKNMACIEIDDTGCGIAPESLPSIFDRFYREDSSRTKTTGGSGLGLALVKKIVSIHGGYITVRSKKNEGSLFIVRLPLSETEDEV